MKLLYSLLAITLATTYPSISNADLADDFIDSARGKVVTWAYNGNIYSSDYVDSHGDFVLTARFDGYCDKGIFTTNGNQICYNFSGDLKGTNEFPEDCWSISKLDSHYQMSYIHPEEKYEIVANITNDPPFTCN